MVSTKRAQLMRTAEALFYTHGFHATGIDTIVAHAGVVRMTLYNHFGSKESLVAAVLEDRHARFTAHLDAALAASAPGGATRALVAAHGEWVRETGASGCILVKAMGEFAEHSAEIYEQARAAKADLRTRVRRALAADGFPTDTGLDLHIYLALEGANSAVPVMGADAALSETDRLVATLLANARGGTA